MLKFGWGEIYRYSIYEDLEYFLDIDHLLQLHVYDLEVFEICVHLHDLYGMFGTCSVSIVCYMIDYGLL